MRDPRLTVDKAGRVVLPKALRERFRLRPGSELDVVVRDDHLELRPRGQGPALVDEDGWWVHAGAPESGSALEDAVRRDREERLEDLAR